MGSEGIGEALRMERERAGPCPVEHRPRQPPPQPMRAGGRHACGPRRLRHIAGREQGGEEKALPLRRPADAVGCGRIGVGLLVHRQG